ncbi:ECF transporter S component [Ligilactobacillus sp. WILCCON 0076]|uniref:Riboflavin transporter n=1 Tax=Ligilactobacillus ubinensis TaxID=2876789 RepID=A0A9X2FK11_9LACO|nr:ECF transporter S component [Ligilactobacillus ubinensis]MCP0886161.1 ECF transporter S component [Ligilactobacillus ubinensis]
MSHLSTRKYVIIACLAAISYLLMFLSFSIIPLVPWMKIDFADIPILLGFFTLGPLGGVMIAIVRSILYLIISGISVASIIGVGTNLLASFALCLPIYYVLNKKINAGIKDYTLATIAGTTSLTFFLSIANWTVITPLYIAVLGMKLSVPLNQLILFGVVPFNLIKGVVVSALFAVIYVKLHAWLQAKARQLSTH